MPRGILSRAIVKLHNRIDKQEWVWRSGVILAHNQATAEVLELRGEKQIRIRVSGHNKQDLLTEIRTALDELHKPFTKLRVERQIPCNCETCLALQAEMKEPHFYDHEKLKERLAYRRSHVPCEKPPSYHQVAIQSLLSEFPSLEHRLFDPQSRDRHDYVIHAERVIHGNYCEGDSYEWEEVTNVPAPANGQGPASRQPLSAEERQELARLTEQKSTIEAPLRRWARLLKRGYIIGYLAMIGLVWWLLNRLVAWIGWDALEPLTWIFGMVMVLAAPLLAWLDPDRFRPRNIEARLFEHWRKEELTKYNFDGKRFAALSKRTDSE